MFTSGYEARTICFILWFLGTLVVFWMGSTGTIRTDHFNNVPWKHCLKSPHHQVFIGTFTAWITMWFV